MPVTHRGDYRKLRTKGGQSSCTVPAYLLNDAEKLLGKQMIEQIAYNHIGGSYDLSEKIYRCMMAYLNHPKLPFKPKTK